MRNYKSFVILSAFNIEIREMQVKIPDFLSFSAINALKMNIIVNHSL